MLHILTDGRSWPFSAARAIAGCLKPFHLNAPCWFYMLFVQQYFSHSARRDRPMGWLHGRRPPVITPPLLRLHYGSTLVSTTSLLHPSYEYSSAWRGDYSYYPYFLYFALPCRFVWNVVCHYNEVHVYGRNSSSIEPLGGARVVIEKRRYLKYYLSVGT